VSALKRLSRAPAVQATLGRLAADYLALVRRTTRFAVEPEDARPRLIEANFPLITATWHGQHLMVPFFFRPGYRAATLVSRSGDGGINAAALERMGIRAIRGSGARGRDVRAKGGAPALRSMLRALADGESVAMTADVPKIARRCGEGVVLLASLSGRPILPMAVATRRRFTFGSWDRACLGKPFGPGAMVVGEPITVPRDAGADGLEAARRAVEAELDRVHARAFAMVGRTDPMREPP
jgi:lysophospholipid acyltransferase (LPLAT)-like uncharacterized protein